MTTLALIGVGAWGKHYITTAQELSGVRISDICARHNDSLDPYRAEYEVTTNYKDILSKKNIDGVIIATPASTHYRVARDFLQEGHHVLIEKPVSQHVSEIEELEFLARKNNLIAMVGHEYVYNTAFQKVKELLGKIGDICYVSGVDGNLGPIREDISPLWDWSPHMISMLIGIFGMYPQIVNAHGVKIDQKKNFFISSQITLSFGERIPVFLRVGSLEIPKKRTLSIVGTNGTIVFDDLALHKVHMYAYKDFVAKQTQKQVRYNNEKPLVSQLKAFIKSIKTGTQPLTNLDHAKEVTQIISTCEKLMA